MARDQAFDRQIALALRGVEADVQRLFVAEIRNQLARVNSESRPAGHTQWIDGQEGAPIDGVSAFGTALFEFRYLPEILPFALNILWATSPVDEKPTADDIVFRESRLLFVDGVFHSNVKDGMSAADFGWLLRHPKGVEITITDDEPYAGMLEAGYSEQAPDGVYQVCCNTLRRRYGNLVTVEFRWTRVAGAPRGTPAMVIREI